MTALSIAESTLVGLLRARACTEPLGRAMVMLDEGTEHEVLTYGELDRSARAIGAQLRDSGAEGTGVLLLYPPGFDFVRAFFGCLYAKAIAIPCMPPVSGRQIERLEAIVRNADAKFLLCNLQTSDLVGESKLASLRRLKWITLSEKENTADFWRPPKLTPSDFALLQYTSGSTRNPRGVILSHANVIANSLAISDAFHVQSNSVIVNWLPPYHDMGLIGGIVQPIFSGATCVMMPPATFLQRPYRWLKAISDYRATISGGPNFAYDLCTAKISAPERETLNLSSWRAAFTGSEPVFAETLERFANVFSSCGFKSTSFLPCYGLAESTLMVTGAHLGSGATAVTFDAEFLEFGQAVRANSTTTRVRRMTSCGPAIKGHEIAIVNPSVRERLGEAQIGEVWVTGPSVAPAYWASPDETISRFGATISGETDGPYLRTGDLGCIIEGELFITGRAQDLIIIRGRNHHAEDIEETVRTSHPLLALGRGTAFQVRKDELDSLVIVHEAAKSPTNDYTEVLTAITAAVGARHGVMPTIVQLVRRNSVPRTTSGKVRRAACRDDVLTGRLPVLAALDRGTGQPNDNQGGSTQAADAGGIAENIRGLVARVLGVAENLIDVESPLVSLGMDSIAATEIAFRVGTLLGVEVPLASLLNDWSVADLVRHGSDLAPSDPRESPHATETERNRQSLPATTDQQRLWIQHRLSSNPSALNLQKAYACKGPLDAITLSAAFRAVVRRHSSLRTGFKGQDPLMQCIQDVESGIEIADCTDIALSDHQALIRAFVGEELKRCFDLAVPPLIRLALLRLADNFDVLVLTVHHIVADAASLHIIMRDLQSAYNTTASANEDCGRVKQYSDYAQIALDASRDKDGTPQLHLGATLMNGVQPLFTERDRLEQYSETQFGLSASEYDFLKEFARTNTTTIFTVILAAFQIALHLATGRNRFAVVVPFANRPSTDFSNAVGTFAQPRFIVADVRGELNLEAFVACVKTALIKGNEYCDVSITEMARQSRVDFDAPLRIEALFTMLPSIAETLDLGNARLDVIETLSGAQDCDLFVAVRRTGAGGLDVKTISRISANRTAEIQRTLSTLLKRLGSYTGLQITDLIDALVDAGRMTTVRVRIAATFAAEPLKAVFDYWTEFLKMDLAFEFAPYSQLAQEILNPASLMHRNRLGINVLLLRETDLAPGGRVDCRERIALSVSEFANAVLRLADQAGTHQIVCLCPIEGANQNNNTQHTLQDAWRGAKNITLLLPADIAHLYPVERPYDKYGESAVDLPYTEAYFAALGTTIIRRICAAERRFLRKVIAVDCDNTLWDGVVSEDSASGVVVTERCRKLQRWLKDRKQNGLLICLCSKSNETDVRSVFEADPNMILKWTDLASWRINWNDKSANLSALAEELSLGLNSFVFLDDSRIECAEVEANCPETLCIHISAENPDPEALLRHIWACDSMPVSVEAARRTELYREQAARVRALGDAPSLADFLQRLETKIEMFQPSTQDVLRLAELTARTTQFNSTPEARSESDFFSWIGDPAYIVRATRVEDRFGSLGIVGGTVFRREGSILRSEVFLLSCRALGRGIEHSMLAETGRIAEHLGCSHVVILYRRTDRNEPVRRFLETVAADLDRWRKGEAYMTAGQAAKVKYMPTRSDFGVQSESPVQKSEPKLSMVSPHFLRNLASMHDSATSIVSAMRSRLHKPETVRTILPPRTPTEVRIGRMMAELLGLEQVGRDEEFFALGGHSLLGARLLSRVAEEFQVIIPLERLFMIKPTVSALSEVVDAEIISNSEVTEIETALTLIKSMSDAEIETLLAADVAGLKLRQN